jgi:hypothetical protein
MHRNARLNSRFRFACTKKNALIMALLTLAWTGVSSLTALGQVIVQGTFYANSGQQLLNPSNKANAVSTITPLINPCPTSSGYTGTGCSWPITLSETKQWPDPDIVFTVEAPYNTTAYNVTWKMTVTYSDPCALNSAVCNKHVVPADNLQYSSTAPGNQTWSPFLTTSGTEFIGSAKVEADVKSANSCNHGVIGTLSFEVWGVNQNSSQTGGAANAANSSYLANQGWFLPYMIAQESLGGLQFKTSNGHPLWGPPDGIGIMQIDRVVNPQYYTNNNEDPYIDFTVNAIDGAQILAAKQKNSAAPCNTPTGEVSSSCTKWAYDFWDRQVWQACEDSGGSTTPTRYGGPGTESCNKTVPQPQYPGGAPALTHCTSALSWNEQTPNGHFQDLNWIQTYNGTPCGYFLSWDRKSRSWVFKTAACVVGSTNYGNYVVNVCQHAAAY